MILEFDWNRGLFVARCRGSKIAVNRPKLAFAVSPKNLSSETKIYIFITRIPRVIYISFWGFFKNSIFPTSGRYLQTSALKIIWVVGVFYKSSYRGYHPSVFPFAFYKQTFDKFYLSFCITFWLFWSLRQGKLILLTFSKAKCTFLEQTTSSLVTC